MNHGQTHINFRSKQIWRQAARDLKEINRKNEEALKSVS